jgi:hypothetical protein
VRLERCVTVDPKAIPPVQLPEELRETSGETSPLPTPHEIASAEKRVNLWLLRIRALLFVTLCATLGVLLVILPWTPKWTDNPLLLSWPGLRSFVSNGFMRNQVNSG